MRPLRLAVSAAPLAFGLHVADEAPGFALSLATTALDPRGGRRGFLAHYTSLTSQAVFNAIFHVARRAPGGRTAVGVVLPLWLATTALGRLAGLLDARTIAAALALGGPLHAAAVARQVYRVL